MAIFVILILGLALAAFLVDNEPGLTNQELIELNALTGTFGTPVGVQGFEEDELAVFYDPDEIVEAIVQFITPSAVALRHLGYRGLNLPQPLPGETYEEQALSAHIAFATQLAELESLTGVEIEVFSENYRLFNGVHIRVPRSLLHSVASLDESFFVTPVIELTPALPLVETIENPIVVYENSFVELEPLSTSPFFVNPEFMRRTREYFDMDYININMGLTGQGIRVGVIDSGIDTNHPEFIRFQDENGRIRGSVNGESNHFVNSNHGTTVSGGIIGIAPNIELWNYRINLGEGSETDVTPIQALEQAHMDEMNVINMSIANTTFHPFHPMNAVINLITIDGVVVVVAAGNFSMAGVPVVGNASLAISVGATYRAGYHDWCMDTPSVSPRFCEGLKSYSSRGLVGRTNHIKPDIIAPTSIMTTNVGGGYILDGRANGTSHAAPIIAGLAALILENDPELIPNEVKALIMNTARPLDPITAGDEYFLRQLRPSHSGAGLVQPFVALLANIVATVQHEVPTTANEFAPWQIHNMASLSFGHIDIRSDYAIELMPLTISNKDITARELRLAANFIDDFEGTTNITFSDSFGVIEGYFTIDPGEEIIIEVVKLVMNHPFTRTQEGFIHIYDDLEDRVVRLPFASTSHDRTSPEEWLREMIASAAYSNEPVKIVLEENIEMRNPAINVPAGAHVILSSPVGEDVFLFGAGVTFDVSYGATFTLDGVDLYGTGESSSIGVINHGVFNFKSGYMSRMNNASTGVFNMYGGTITRPEYRDGPLSPSGGPVFTVIQNRGEINLHGGYIINNRTTHLQRMGSPGTVEGNQVGSCMISESGVISNWGAGGNFPVLNMTGGTLSGNLTEGNQGVITVGGGVGSGGIVNIAEGIFTQNSTERFGQEFYTVFALGGTCDNREHNGGVISILGGGTANITGGTFSYNNALQGRGGVISQLAGRLSISGGYFYNNVSRRGGGVSTSHGSVQNSNLTISEDVLFINNIATTGPQNRLPQFDTQYNNNISTRSWSIPFAQGFNNFDIHVDTSDEIPITTIEYLHFDLNDSAYSPATLFSVINNRIQVVASSVLPSNATTRFGVPIVEARDFPTITPIRGGYQFLGWYLDAATTIPLLPTTLLDEEMTIFARWSDEFLLPENIPTAPRPRVQQ